MDFTGILGINDDTVNGNKWLGHWDYRSSWRFHLISWDSNGVYWNFTN